MNTTNRALNRSVVFVVGLLVLAVGAAAILLASLPGAAAGWKDTAPTVGTHVDDAFGAAPLFATGGSWLAVAAVVVLAVLIVLLLVFIIRQGNGHTGELFRDETTEHGATVVASTVAKDALQGALADRDDLVSSSVSTYAVKGGTVLKIAATARRGASPKDIAASIEQHLRSLDLLLGFEVPALIQISGGFRAATAKSTRLR